MRAGEIIYAKLAATAAVTAIVGTRIYPLDVAIEADLPAVWYDVQLGESGDGSLHEQQAQIQVGCLAHTEAGAHDLAAAVDAALDGMTRSSQGTAVRGMYHMARTMARDAENNIWGVVLAYSAGVTY